MDIIDMLRILFTSTVRPEIMFFGSLIYFSGLAKEPFLGSRKVFRSKSSFTVQIWPDSQKTFPFKELFRSKLLFCSKWVIFAHFSSFGSFWLHFGLKKVLRSKAFSGSKGFFVQIGPDSQKNLLNGKELFWTKRVFWAKKPFGSKKQRKTLFPDALYSVGNIQWKIENWKFSQYSIFNIQ